MSAVITPENKLTEQLSSQDLLPCFESCSNQMDVLSLDCFDTLLWRATSSPKDVFFRLQNIEPLKQLGFTADLRERSESLAYQLNRVASNITQVTLYDIYRVMYPALAQSMIETLVEYELAEEMQVCYAFSPVIELIRAAKIMKKKVIVVSDTYYNKEQLRKLLRVRLPQDVMDAIDDVFCSCQIGVGKSDFLFEHIIKKLKLPAQSIMHIGDNVIADFYAPKKYGIKAFQLIKHPQVVDEMLRVQSVCAGFVDSAIYTVRPLYQPFSSLFSQKSNDEPAALIGYVALGSILYAFSKFILAEINQSVKTPKVIFLMRDAYLPSLACDALNGGRVGKNASINRFAATAAAFRHKSDIDYYLAQNISSLHFHDMCKQLLLPENISTSISEEAGRSENPINKFIELIHSQTILDAVIKNSIQYFERLQQYLKNEIGLSSGDTVMFVDLGYTGTAQIKLAPLFKEAMNVDVIGRYLICVRAPGENGDRKGLLDSSYYDDKALSMLVTYIALFEQICSEGAESIIDFDQNGKPIVMQHSININQHQKRQLIQNECLQFVRDAESFMRLNPLLVNMAMLRDTAAISLARFLFLPTQTELEYLQSFNHDVTLGTNTILPMFDINKGLSQLHKRSWLFSLKDNVKHLRAHTPAEWRSANLELSLALMAQHRFGFFLAASDLSFRSEKITAVFSEDKKTFQGQFDARLTHDSFYSLIIPVIPNHEIGIQFAKNYEWLEIESAEIFALEVLHTHHESQTAFAADPYLTTHEMVAKGGNLFECQSDDGMLIFVPTNISMQKQMLLRIVFRPTVRRV